MIFDLGSHCYRHGFTDFQRETRGIRRRLYYNPQRGGVAEKGATRVEKHEGGLVMSQIRLTTMAGSRLPCDLGFADRAGPPATAAAL